MVGDVSPVAMFTLGLLFIVLVITFSSDSYLLLESWYIFSTLKKCPFSVFYMLMVDGCVCLHLGGDAVGCKIGRRERIWPSAKLNISQNYNFHFHFVFPFVFVFVFGFLFGQSWTNIIFTFT